MKALKVLGLCLMIFGFWLFTDAIIPVLWDSFALNNWNLFWFMSVPLSNVLPGFIIFGVGVFCASDTFRTIALGGHVDTFW